jgi:hypothetical protein
MHIAHIINPAVVPKSSDLFTAQPITFETMRIAQEYAKPDVDVTLFSAQYSEDRDFIPGFFQKTPDLERSVVDFGNFKEKRKLPLLRDILDRLYEGTDAEYLIYTNVDIALMPFFYLSVKKIIESGYDAFVVKTRIISDHYKDVSEIPRMYIEIGEKERGYDCFVFKRDSYPKYRLGDVCVGVGQVGKVLLWNLEIHAVRFQVFKGKHLTFHIGDQKIWKKRKYDDYLKHNMKESMNVIEELEKEYNSLKTNLWKKRKIKETKKRLR